MLEGVVPAQSSSNPWEPSPSCESDDPSSTSEPDPSSLSLPEVRLVGSEIAEIIVPGALCFLWIVTVRSIVRTRASLPGVRMPGAFTSLD